MAHSTPTDDAPGEIRKRQGDHRHRCKDCGILDVCPDRAEDCIHGVGAEVVCTGCMDERAFGGGPDA